ncbi:integrase catalytic domain-containing protein [Trichonephila clavipes]|uniref:Integrase catalytic domain-containing protein n=1 Tax=Trichonephila clavipes TaxID=2585209 RepID=A0A8X6S6K0_TRICX|nr:integrase catalytic domain-containing protein [Trichonephila clavipes]
MSDMYIDDVLTGAETLLEAKELKNQLINIFAKGGMVLHKWCGNNTELIEVSENYDFSDSSEIKVLGVYWNPKHDCFSFRVKIDLHELNTKRDVLSTIARIYDPLGLLGPVVAKAKIFLQKLWMLKIDWTDLLPDTINREWRQFVESLQVVNDININRCIVVEQTGSDRAAWILRRVPVSIWSCRLLQIHNLRWKGCLCILLPVNPELRLPSKQRFPDLSYVPLCC